MTALRDLHVHTNFCDGKNTPEEMVLSAIGKGLECLGLCAHAFVPFDSGYCMSPDKYEDFRSEISRLKKKYSGQIRLLCGIEQDIYSPLGTGSFDYVIGSVHYLKAGSEYIPVDAEPQILRDGCEKCFSGDYSAMAVQYYEALAQVVSITHCDIIAHFDLLTKFNETDSFFDESDPRYIRAYKAAADHLIPYGKPFEINTGAISRGYRTTPYPARPILDYIKAGGGNLILSSDAHSKESIAYQFEEFLPLCS
ncbi:MAG: histidinol-phosphatase [Eubacteriales bacterium]|nr:histidinol-phosphatase [Eubacteriales bacterium]